MPSSGFQTEAQLYKKLSKDLEGKTLAKKFQDPWILDLHISNVVKISELQQFLEKLNQARFDEQLVLQLILVFACCIFSIAAENRFISHSEINGQGENKPLNNSERLLENYSKELSLQKHQRILYSERIHLKAIEMLFFGIDTNAKLFQHFLQSYKQNYDFNMHMIQEVDEPSVTSIKNSEYFG